MKPILSCFMLIVLLTSCHSKKTAHTQNTEKKSAQNKIEILYGAHTRGYFLEISLTKNKLTKLQEKFNNDLSEYDDPELEILMDEN